MMRAIFVAAIATVAATGPLAAQDLAVRASYDAIASGDFDRAEQRLSAERRIYPNRPEVLLNLAAVYAETGRSGQAASLYRQVLSQRDVLMDLDAARTATAHNIAQSGMRRLDLQTTALR